MVDKLRHYCYKVLPLVYDDSLSYYELLCKVVDKLNEVIETTTETIKYANPIQWSIASQYADKTVVVDENTGIAYLSVQPVPRNVDITNTEYWTPIFDLSKVIMNLVPTIKYDEPNVNLLFEGFNDGSTQYTSHSVVNESLVIKEK